MLKKGKKSEKTHKKGTHEDSHGQSHADALAKKQAAYDHVFDMEPTKQLNRKAIDDLKAKLAETKAFGNTVDSKIIGKLMVQPDKSSPSMVKLQDVAQVVSRGRHINVILSDESVRNCTMPNHL